MKDEPATSRPTERAGHEIIGDPEMLERLRVWAEPLVGPMNKTGPGSLLRLQEIIEAAAQGSGITPQYRKPQA